MKKTYLDALMSIFTPIPLNNGFYFVDNNGTIDWILSNIFLLGYVLPVEGVMIGIFFYLLLSHAIEHKTQLISHLCRRTILWHLVFRFFKSIEEAGKFSCNEGMYVPLFSYAL